MLSCFSCAWLFATVRTVSPQAPLSMGFSRQEYWSGLLCPPPGDLPDPRDWTCVSHVSCISRLGSLPLVAPGKPFLILVGSKSLRWRRQWHPTPVLLPGKSHGQRSLVGCSPWGHKGVGHDWATSLSLFTFHFHTLEKEMATHSSTLSWRIPGMAEPGGLQSMGSHRVEHDWSDLAAAAAYSNKY